VLRLVKLELKGSVQLKSKVKICIYIYGFISLTSIPDISTALMRPRRPKQYCLQLVICIYIYIHITNCRQYCFGLLGLISAVLMSGMEVKLIKPYIYIHILTLLFNCTLPFNSSFTSRSTGYALAPCVPFNFMAYR